MTLHREIFNALVTGPRTQREIFESSTIKHSGLVADYIDHLVEKGELAAAVVDGEIQYRIPGTGSEQGE